MTNKAIKDQFQRVETKYILSTDKLVELLMAFEEYLQEDEYAHSTISNLYYDTPTYQIIRESFDNPHLKEKLRLRTYEPYPAKASQVFLEIKQKIGGVVHKRRAATSLANAEMYLAGEQFQLEDDQLRAEVDYLCQRYGEVQPMMYIYYNRYSLKGIDDSDIRITIDHDLVYRQNDLTLLAGCHGENLLEDGQVIMEVKVPDVYPDWLTEILEEAQLYPSSFSKYGVAYEKTTGHKTADKHAQPVIS